MSLAKTALVIGGGPAGLSSALGLLRAGYHVDVADQRLKWTGRVCGSFLNAESVQHLKWLGVWDEIQNRRPAEVTTSDVCSHTRNSYNVGTVQRGTNAVGLPRKDLEEILLTALEKAGGTFHSGARVVQTKKELMEWQVTISTGASFATSLLVHADGRFTLADSTHSLKSIAGWYGWNATFRNVDQAPGGLSLHLYPGGYVGVLTFADGTTNVCGLAFRERNEALLWDHVFEKAQFKNPALKQKLRAADRITEWQGVGPLPFCFTMREGPGSFLTGDAAAVGDPFMGEGIGRALGAGPMLYETLKQAGEVTNTADKRQLRTYQLLWKKSYLRRLQMGHWFRKALVSPATLPAVSKILFSNQWLLKWATSRFHVGYNEPQSNILIESRP